MSVKCKDPRRELADCSRNRKEGRCLDYSACGEGVRSRGQRSSCGRSEGHRNIAEGSAE